MPPTVAITSLTNPRVKQVVKLREHRERRRTGLFIAEGLREVTRAAAAGLRMRELWLCPELLGATRVDIEADAAFEVPTAVLRKMAYVREPEGVLAVVDQPPPEVFLESSALAAGDALLLVAVGTEKPGNLGAMVRTADAAGCAGVLAAGTPVDVFNPNAIRTSTAAVFTLPVLCLDEAAARDWLLQHRFKVFATSPHGGDARLHTEVDYTGRVAIVIGPEDRGLDDAWYDLAQQTSGGRVTIAMHARAVDSLNASTSAAVMLFEALRRRG